MKICRSSTFLTWLVTVSLAWGGVARAEDQAQQSGGSGQLEEVVVTSQKRSEDVRTIPVSISVLNGFALKSQKIDDLDDITRALPSVSLTEGGAEGLSYPEMRGVSSTSGSATVGIYLDEVPITVKNTVYDGSTQPKLFDIDRIEVLRGPQGTLYGASSMGGTIRFITKQPNLQEFSGNVSATLSGTEHAGLNYETDGVVNIPIIEDVFAIRLGAQYSLDSGYIDNYNFFTGNLAKQGVNDERALTIKLTGLIQPSDDVKITPSLFYQRDKTGDTSVFYPAFGLWKQNKQVDEWGRDTVIVPSLTVDADLGFAKLTSVSSYFWRQYRHMTDGTYYNSVIFATVFLDPNFPNKQAQNDSLLATSPSPSPASVIHHQISQELRLSSPPPEESGIPLKWVAGLYYSNYWDDRQQPETIVNEQSILKSIYGADYSNVIQNTLIQNGFYQPPNDPHIFDNDIFFFETARFNERQYAAFGQVDFDILPTLHGAAGIRYVYARSSETRVGGGFIDNGNVHPFNEVSRYYAVTPKFSVNYDLTPEVNIYATAAKGFRLGGPTGPDPVGLASACGQDYINLGITNPPTKFDSDKLWSYELGTKARLLDNTLSVSGAVFYIDWQKIQQTIVLPICGFTFTDNVGNAESYGAEIEIAYKPIAELTLGLNGSVDHAVITSTKNPGTVQVGEKVLNVPDWTMDISAEYSIPLTDELLGFVRVDYDWIGRSHGSYITTSPNFSNPQYDVLNASLGVDMGDIKVSVFAKNLNDNRTIIQQPTINTVTEGYTVRPRTFGVTVTDQF